MNPGHNYQNPTWTDPDIELLIELKEKGWNSRLIAKKLNRTPQAIKNKWYWIKTHTTYEERKFNPHWTHDETELLIALAETMPRSRLLIRYNQIAKQKGFTKRSLNGITQKLHKLGQSTKPSSGWYGTTAIALGLGFSLNRIHGWLKKGLKHHAEGEVRNHYYVRNDDLADFIKANPSCLQGIKDDGVTWFINLLNEVDEMKGRIGRPEYTRALEA